MSLTHLARNLRNNATDAERLLWNKLKGGQIEGVKFRRQQPIDGFIVDFVSFERRVVIELDGGQHVDECGRDEERDHLLSMAGFKVLRFWNSDLFQNFEGVLETIRAECVERDTLPLTPSRRGRG